MYMLTVFIFTIAQGHMLAVDSYRDRILLGPYPTLQACEDEGQKHFDGFHSTVDPRLQSYDMLGYQCTKVSK